jgi:hypothetical protein
MNELQNLTSLNDKKLLVVLPIKKVADVFLKESSYSIAQQSQPIDLLVLYGGESDDDLNIIKSILDKPSVTINEKTTPEGPVEQKEIEATSPINYVINKTENHTFQGLFNEALNYAIANKYEYFSIIEAEDVLDMNWYKTALNYASKKNDMDGFMPVTREISNGNFLGFFNEACWVDGYAEVAGTFDLQLLMRFNCMNITGAIFKTESIQKYSTDIEGQFKAIKEDFKISYSYEFFLRMIYNDLKFFTIPRLGYEHRIDIRSEIVEPFSSKIPRNISVWPKEKGGMSPEEVKFWIDAAKREYFLGRHDRPIAFEETAVAQ